MEEEVQQVEEQEAPEGYINISATDTNIKYDTNLSMPEVVFWLRVVEKMAIDQVMSANE